MGFKYVLIPASTNEPMEELEYKDAIDDLSKDSFREMCEQYFSKLGQTADRQVLMQQLKERTGMDLQDETAKSKVSSEALDRLLTASSVEIFPAMLPTKDTGFHGISMYCDDKGIAKGLEENSRASGLIQACGYPGQTFRGDIFMGRVFDDTEDIWRRIDFVLSDCSTDAEWAGMTRKQRSNRSSGDLKSFADKIGVNNPANINPSTMQDSTPTGETETYKWRQTEEEVEVTFKQEGLVKGDKKAVKVVFARQRLKVEVKGQVLIDGTLAEFTQPDESSWTLSDGVLQVNLAKVGEASWASLLKA